jgi:peptidoglycan/xylan/chitin deacetylase (PgdA/CDA1 family)
MVDAVTGKNVKQVSDALQAAGVGATLFLETKDVGLSGITEKTILNLMANGNDLQSAGHTGDDLRSMTDSQVALELGQSKKLIEDITHKEVYAVSYARGGVNDRVMQQAAQMGYLFGLGQSPDKQFTRSQFLRLPTLLVTSGMSEQDIVKLVK